MHKIKDSGLGLPAIKLQPFQDWKGLFEKEGKNLMRGALKLLQKGGVH